MKGDFNSLHFDLVLSTLERGLGRTRGDNRATGRIIPLNSLENRVFEVEFEDGVTVVTKFYRPLRWNESQILAEHAFLEELKLAEIPTVPALPIQDLAVGPTLGCSDGYFFAVFPKVRGRIEIDPNDEQLTILGRTLGRMHAAGQKRRSLDRPTLDASHGRRSLEVICALPMISDVWRQRYRSVAEPILQLISPLLETVPRIALHGDFHPGNVLWMNDQPHIVDFDDMVLGPAMQDLWLISRGRDERSLAARRALLEGYAEFQQPPEQDSLIEPLRFLRILNFSAWIGERFADQSFGKTFPTFGTDTYWQSEVEALSEIAALVDQKH